LAESIAIQQIPAEGLGELRSTFIERCSGALGHIFSNLTPPVSTRQRVLRGHSNFPKSHQRPILPSVGAIGEPDLQDTANPGNSNKTAYAATNKWHDHASAGRWRLLQYSTSKCASEERCSLAHPLHPLLRQRCAPILL
jgi:hypothetical protein